jgi:hypothetical protein
MISKEELEKFKAIYRKKFGKDISDEEALRQAVSLITLVKAVYKPIERGGPEEIGRKK